jgi:type IV pilus assembly protein PilX
MTPALRNSMHSMPLLSRQRGATLIVGLVLMLVLTVLGVSGMNTATTEITMAGNTQFQEDAFQLTEDAADIAIGTRDYSTDTAHVVDWLGDPDYDRRAVVTWCGCTTDVPDAAFSSDEVVAYHFDINSVGRGPRNATSNHRQGFYVIGRKQ